MLGKNLKIRFIIDEEQLRWSIDYLLKKNEKPTKKRLKEFLMGQLYVFGMDNLIGYSFYTEPNHEQTEEYFNKLKGSK